MKILYDTSVLASVCVSDHPKHEICNAYYNRGLSGDHEVMVCVHSLAELYSTLTRLPIKPRISPGSARYIIKENILRKVRVIELSHSDYEKALDFAMDRGICGGTIYDILIFLAAKRGKADKIATLNVKHFVSISADEIDFIQPF